MVASIPDRVLIVRLGAIGDVVNALVLATALRDARPDVHIGWAVHPLARPLVEGHPAVDRVHIWERKAGSASFLRLVRELRRERYDLAIDLQRIAKSGLLARLSGAPRVLGFDRRRVKEASWLFARERIPRGDPDDHMVHQYLEFARHLGVTNPSARHELPTDAQAAEWAERLIAELGAAPVLINLGATKPANRWAPERFGQLAGLCSERFEVPVCIIGGPGDRALAEAALARVGDARLVRDLVGATNLLQLIALQARARLMVTCDTGPMHLAAAVGLPVVALFGAADPRRTGPFGDLHRLVVGRPACAPCNRRTCPLPRHLCMDDMPLDEVVEAVSASLGGG